VLVATLSGPALSKPADPIPNVSVAPLPSALLAQGDTHSPVIDPDLRATFTFRSSTAKSVEVFGGWGPSFSLVATPMTQTAAGVWTAVVGPLTPGSYAYYFIVDGVPTRDPLNPNRVTTNRTPEFTTFFIPGRSVDWVSRQNVKHGEVTELTYPSAVTGTSRQAAVWTPPGYEDSKRKYPVFYLLFGGGGGDLDWIQFNRANLILDNLLAAGRIKPMVVVMPHNGQLPGAQGGMPETDPIIPEMLDNLIPAVEQGYRVHRDPANRALAGLSFGGFQTFDLVLTHPREFAYVGNFSSGLFPPALNAIRTSAMLTPERIREINQLKLFRIYVGDANDIATDANAGVKNFFDEYGINYQFNGAREGYGHVFRTWQLDLHDFAPLLFRGSSHM
jgi:enterochelin esterase family protein